MTRTAGPSQTRRSEPTSTAEPPPHAWAGWGEAPLGRVS